MAHILPNSENRREKYQNDIRLQRAKGQVPGRGTSTVGLLAVLACLAGDMNRNMSGGLTVAHVLSTLTFTLTRCCSPLAALLSHCHSALPSPPPPSPPPLSVSSLLSLNSPHDSHHDDRG